MLRRIWLGLCVVVVISLGLACPSAPVSADGQVPRYEKAKCKFEVPKGYTVQCGYLVVPEDRSNPQSKTIRLHVAVFKARNKKPAPDAVIYLEGGPGGHSLETAKFSFPGVFAAFAKTRDFVMFDQRGVGYSEPSLDCPEETKAAYDGLTQRMSFEEREALIDKATIACHDRLVAQGINLSTYNSAENAADVNDLRLVLGYKAWDLYGISYGTRLALTIMRDFPNGIRSVILDSTVPLQVDFYNLIPSNANRAFQIFFEACLRNRPCNAAYPNLDKVFYDTVDKLNKKPASITVKQPYTGKTFKLLIDGHLLIRMLFNSLYSSDVIVYLPKVIYDASVNKYALLEKLMAGSLVKKEFDSTGMYFSVQCAEEIAFDTQETLDNADQAYPNLSHVFDMGDYYRTCQQWNVKAAQPVENKAVVSDAYTLVLAGAYDPITPPRYGQLAAQSLKNSFYIEFPGVGHGASVGHWCPYQVALAFLENPKTRPEIGCIAAMLEPQFVTK
jgi:pimeloyl-ACP methyl ester carboxylesterase